MDVQSIRPDAKFGQAINEESALKSAASVQMFHFTTIFRLYVCCNLSSGTFILIYIYIYIHIHMSYSVLKKTYVLSFLASLSSFVHWANCYSKLGSPTLELTHQPFFAITRRPFNDFMEEKQEGSNSYEDPGWRTGWWDSNFHDTTWDLGTGKASKIRCHTGQIAGP